MRQILTTALIVILAGCGTRAEIPKAESEVRATINHSLTRREAYDRAEVSMVSLFNNPLMVTQVRQRDNGHMILKGTTAPIVLQRDPLGIADDVTMTLPIVVDVQTGDGAATVAYVVTGRGTPDQRARNSGWTSGYPADMRPVLDEFHAAIDKIAADLGGTVVERTPKPPAR